jgi:guanine deaminase
MYLDDKIGSLAAGMEADLVVLDMRSTPLIDFRMTEAKDFAEQLFIQMTLGDDRAVQATYVAGRLAYARGGSDGAPTPPCSVKFGLRSINMVADWFWSGYDFFGS